MLGRHLDSSGGSSVVPQTFVRGKNHEVRERTFEDVIAGRWLLDARALEHIVEHRVSWSACWLRQPRRLRPRQRTGQNTPREGTGRNELTDQRLELDAGSRELGQTGQIGAHRRPRSVL